MLVLLITYQKNLTVGADYGDEFIIGAALSLSQNKIRVKDLAHTKQGLPAGNDNITHYNLSLYGTSYINDNIFVDGQIKYGMLSIKKNKLISNLSQRTYSGKTKGQNYGIQAGIGQNFNPIQKLSIIPTAHLSYDKYRINSSKETGTNVVARKINTVESSKLVGTLGIKTRYELYNCHNTKITPELLLKLDHLISESKGKVVVGFDHPGVYDYANPKSDSIKHVYSAGTGLNIVFSNYIDTKVGYTLSKADKYFSHAGHISLNVSLG